MEEGIMASKYTYKAVTADDCAKCWNTPIDD